MMRAIRFASTLNFKIEQNSLEAIKEEWAEVEYKKEGDDYVIAAGNNDAVYSIKLQVIRIK